MSTIKLGTRSTRPCRSAEGRMNSCGSWLGSKFPKIFPSYNSSGLPRLQVLLDLDSTCINSLAFSDELKHVPQSLQDKFKYFDMDKYYRIFERPYLQDFLDYIFAHFDVSIFTAADKDYALFIADNIILKKPGRKLKYFFYGVHSGVSENLYRSPKDLRLLWDTFRLPGFSRCNTVIIDDLDLVYKANPKNTLVAPKFELLDDKKKVDYTMQYDNFLLSAIPQLEARNRRFLAGKCGCPKGSKCGLR